MFLLLLRRSLNLAGCRGTTYDVATIPFHLSLSSVTLRESPNSIPVHSLALSSVFLSLLLLSLSPAELSSPCQRILRCGHTICVSVSSPWLGDLNALKLHSGLCCEPPRSSHGLCRKYSEVSYQGFGSFSRVLRSMSRKVGKIVGRISLTLEASEMFVYRHMIFNIDIEYPLMTNVYFVFNRHSKI